MKSVDLEMEQGATFRVELTYEDDTLQPIPLAGYRAHMQVRQRVGAEVLLDLSTENDRITLGDSDGVITLHVGASATATVDRNAVYDLHLIQADDADEVIRVFGGKVLLTKAVTVDD